MTLQQFKDKGVTSFHVKDGEAVSVNPYRVIYNDNQEDWIDFELYRTANPIPAPSIPDGTYAIDAFDEWDVKIARLASQALGLDHKKMPLKGSVLILKKVKEEPENNDWINGDDLKMNGFDERTEPVVRTAEEILELYFGAEFYVLEEQDHLRFILSAMEEYASMKVATLAELEKEINELGPAWNLFGKVDRMKSLLNQIK